MTLSSTQTRAIYAGDGTTVNFAVPFTFFGAEELTVMERALDRGVRTVKTLGTDYTVAGGNGDTGTVTALTAPSAAVSWTILRKTNRTQLVDYTPNDPFPAETLERALDRQAAVSQELDDALARSAQLSPTTALDGLEMPDPEAYSFLRWNGNENGLENAVIQPSSSVIQAREDMQGIVRLATIAEIKSGSDMERAATSAGVASLWRKGVDIAAASILARPADADLGGYHVVTGTTPIIGLWSGEVDGTEIELRFAAVCALAHHATNFILPGGVSVTTSAGDVARFRSEGGQWRCVTAPPSWYAIAATPSFSANKGGTDQTGVASATFTKITFPIEEWDVGGYYDAANSIFTPPPGKYCITASVFFFSGVIDQALYRAGIFKNGALLKSSGLNASGTSPLLCEVTVLADANGTDYFESYAYGGGAGNKTIGGDVTGSFFQAVKVA